MAPSREWNVRILCPLVSVWTETYHRGNYAFCDNLAKTGSKNFICSLSRRKIDILHDVGSVHECSIWKVYYEPDVVENLVGVVTYRLDQITRGHNQHILSLFEFVELSQKSIDHLSSLE